MSMELFGQGMVLGLAIAAPVGPIGVLTIRRTLVSGLLFGLFSGLGAATADGIYGMVAALGLTAVSNFLIQQQFWLRLIGGLFLLYLGIQTIRSKPINSEQYSVNSKTLANDPINKSQLTIFSAFLSSLLLTLSNPVTILSFTAVFAGFGLGSQTRSTSSGLILVAGVFLGSALWWLFLTGMVTAVRRKLNERVFQGINIASGLILMGFALALLVGMVL